MASGQVLDKSPPAGLTFGYSAGQMQACDGVPVKFAKRSTTLAMLALIVLQRGRTISRESLAFTLFPRSRRVRLWLNSAAIYIWRVKHSRNARAILGWSSTRKPSVGTTPRAPLSISSSSSVLEPRRKRKSKQ